MPRKKAETAPAVTEVNETGLGMESMDIKQNPEGEGTVDYENVAGGDNAPAENGTSGGGEIRPERQRTGQQADAPVLTIAVGAEVESQREKEIAVRHEIKNSQITGAFLTGVLGKIERLENGGIISIVDFKGQRVAIPLKEMMLGISRPDNQSDAEFYERAARVLNRMLGAEIDFVIRGTMGTGENQAAVASRKAAMYRLRRRFYLQNSASGKPQIYPGRIVEARIIAVSQFSIRVEIFGVETPISNRNLSWGYVGDCRNEYFVGDIVQVRVQKVGGDTVESLRVEADIKSLTENDTHEKLMALKPQTNCMGKVTDFSGGIAFINLVDGLKAIAHKCYDRRRPGRGDDVLFVCTRIDEENGVAIGIISRIVKRNI